MSVQGIGNHAAHQLPQEMRGIQKQEPVSAPVLQNDGSTSIVGVEKKQIISSSVGRIPGTAFMRGKTGCVF